MLVAYCAIVVEPKIDNNMKEEVIALIRLIFDNMLDDEMSLTSCQIREMLEDALDMLKD